MDDPLRKPIIEYGVRKWDIRLSVYIVLNAQEWTVAMR